MDLGVFKRSRISLAAWIVLPALAIGVSYYALGAYCRYVQQELQQKETLMRLLPEIRRRITVGGDIVRAFALVRGDMASGTDNFGTTLSEAAQRSEIVINTIRVEKEDTGEEEGRIVLRAILESEGSLSGLVRFLDEVQGPQSLTSVESTVLEAVEKQGRMSYEVGLVLRGYMLPM